MEISREIGSAPVNLSTIFQDNDEHYLKSQEAGCYTLMWPVKKKETRHIGIEHRSLSGGRADMSAHLHGLPGSLAWWRLFR